jgi:hydroxypyruvate isomerase
MSKEEKSNVIPLIKEKKTRDIVKKQFDSPPATRPGGLLNPLATKQAELQTMIARINERMSDLRETVRKQNEYLAGTGNELAGAEAVIQREEDAAKQQTSTLDAEALASEYQRKKNAAKKYREENNRKVTREYRLSPKRPGRGDDK